MVVLYNRVPKTGSTSFMKIVYDLTISNEFNTFYINVSASNRVMHLADQTSFVRNVTAWLKARPAFYHGHLPFLNFAKFGSSLRPVYINIIRDPLDRMVSFYYFMRYGDNFRPHLKRRRMGDKTVSAEI